MAVNEIKRLKAVVGIRTNKVRPDPIPLIQLQADTWKSEVMSVYRALGLALLLSGCGGGDGSASSTCNAIRGAASCDAVSGGCSNEGASNDGDLGTFARVSAQAVTSITATRGLSDPTFPSGSNVGVFVTPPSGFSSADITLSTVQGQERAIVQNATGPALTVTPTRGDPATSYISFTATAPFNGLKYTINSGGGDHLIYEFCGSATVH